MAIFISSKFNELQGLYVSDFSSMTYTELNAFLKLLEDDIDAPYRNTRIDRIRRRIDDLNRYKERRDSDRNQWMSLAKEDKERKERWESLGATFREVESSVIWEYEGEPFYTWFSQALIDEEILRSRKADERLNRLLEAE